MDHVKANRPIKFSMVKGDTKSITVRLNGYTPVSGDKVNLTVRREWNDAEKLISKSSGAFNADNAVLIRIDPQDTTNMPPDTYVYDIQLIMGGAVKTLVPYSPFEIIPEVTYGT